jgi:general secretion pathway protein A
MYCSFFNLREEPFHMAPDPRFLFLSQEHRERLASLAYGVLNRKNCLVLTGEIGTGKTTIISAVMEYLPRERTRFCVISIPTLTSSDLLEMILRNFGIKDVPASKAERIYTLTQFLKEGEQRGIVSAVICDEAQKLSPAALEEIRLLGNLNSLGLVLVGQNELVDLLNREELRALKQRICFRLTIGPLREGEVEQYIKYRWQKAGGGQTPPFEPQAVAAVARWSQGVPRLINSICDNALTIAAEMDEHLVMPEHVEAAAARLTLVRAAAAGAGSGQSGEPSLGDDIAPVEAPPATPSSKPHWTLRSVSNGLFRSSARG